MDEQLLQHIWQHQLYYSQDLHTTKGKRVEIINPGTLNKDAGPDFYCSQIMIGDIKWHGCVEIHKKASDWNAHKHSEDKMYNSVVLHVVADYDCDIYNSEGAEIPALVLNFNPKITKNYQQLYESNLWVACEKSFNIIDPFLLSIWLESLIIERLERKSVNILKILSENQNNYNETFYQMLSLNLGFKTNAAPFEIVSRQLKLQTLKKFADDILKVEAAIFGMAGFLENQPVDEYQATLKREFEVLKSRFSLTPVEQTMWKFFRMRPTNFPTQRLAQLSSIIANSTDFVGLLLNIKDLNELTEHFRKPVSDYWQNHINFGKKSSKKHYSLGKESINNILINTVVPFLFVYGLKHGDEELKNKALSWLENIETEDNQIIRKWQTLTTIENAKQSQAFLELKNEYCTNKRCLQCRIGSRIVAEV